MKLHCVDTLSVIAMIAVASTAAASTRKEAIAASHCERELVICYDRNGELIAGELRERLPPTLRPGDKVTVVVITNDKQNDEKAITVTFGERHTQDRLFDNAAPGALKTISDAKDTFDAILFAADPVGDDSSEVIVSFVRNGGPSTTRAIQVDLGYSYYSVALLVAATFKGDRRVLRDLDTVADHAVDPGLALNIFPFGRQRGVIGYASHCRRDAVKRCIANMLGFQVATDFDLTNPTDKLYAGVVLEPVAGLAVVGGVSLRKVAVVPQAGALPALETMDDPAPMDQRYVLRGYVGISVTLDLLNTISAAGSDIRKVKVP